MTTMLSIYVTGKSRGAIHKTGQRVGTVTFSMSWVGKSSNHLAPSVAQRCVSVLNSWRELWCWKVQSGATLKGGNDLAPSFAQQRNMGWCSVAQFEASNSEIERLSKYERGAIRGNPGLALAPMSDLPSTLSIIIKYKDTKTIPIQPTTISKNCVWTWT